MSGRIRTTHAGSLPRPQQLIEEDEPLAKDRGRDERIFQEQLGSSVTDVVSRQRQAGIDIVNDGEFGHIMRRQYDYTPWRTYVFARLGGLDVDVNSHERMRSAKPRETEVVLASFDERRDRTLFADAYADPQSGVSEPDTPSSLVAPVCRGPISYIGHETVARDITNMKAALEALSIQEGFLNSVAPGSCARIANEYYSSDEEMLYAFADALREEYKAIVDAGLILQLDDPACADNWDQIVPEPSIEAYKRFTMVRIDALNHAIRNLPSDRIRYHLCWGSWHGPHVTDIPMRDLVDVMLAVNAGYYSFEAANPRHEHEWHVWQEVKLPDGKKILPGIVTHSTNVVEHPELVAERIERFAHVVGADNVIASTDCGLGGRVHPQIAWAKLEALSQGAAIASGRLYG